MRLTDSRLSKFLLAWGLFVLALIFFATHTNAAISNLRVVNVRNNSFTVTWLTDTAVKGQVHIVGGQSFDELDYQGNQYTSGRGADFVGRTHYINVTNLQPGTTYQFDIVSGNVTDDNGGQHYSASTGPSIPLTGGNDILTGKIFNPDTSVATDAILYFRVKNTDTQGASGNSQWLAAPAPDTLDYAGIWNANLREARTENLTALFAHTNSDQVEIQAYGSTGSWSNTVSLSVPRSQNFSIQLTPYPPTATPTGPTMTATATPTRTATITATQTLTLTVTPTNSPTLTTTLTSTLTPIPSETASPVPTNTPLPTSTRTVTLTPTPTPTSTDTPTPTEVATRSPLQPTPGNTSDSNSRLSSPIFLLLIGIAGVSGGGLLIAIAVYLWRRQANSE